ncbi:MAG: hypothetical protein NTU53_09695, partial [Planctomycetota bacterium]|nr:hypothetical protein [Planctomycetota bacterium]
MFRGLWKRSKGTFARSVCSHGKPGWGLAAGSAVRDALAAGICARGGGRLIEPMESRLMLATDPYISEFMANNDNTLV